MTFSVRFTWLSRTMLNILLLFLLNYYGRTVANTKCSNEVQQILPKYYLIEKCHKSKLGIAAKANYSSLISCQRLATEKRALALNFSPSEIVDLKSDNPIDYTCEVLKCSEVEGGLFLTNDTRFDYYSVHAKPIPDANSSCVPATGMFYLVMQRLNYTQAADRCKNMSGLLADVTSEQRTESLTQLISGAGVDMALVGLRRHNTTDFHGITGDALDYTTYRAWAPGHPRRYRNKYDCVVITRHKVWQSIPCNKHYPVLCELLPGGPYKNKSIFVKKTQSISP